MDLSAINPAILLASLMVAATPIILAALGELVVERAGVLNLGVEGMMITGSIVGFIAATGAESIALGFLASALGGAALALTFALMTQYLLSNQVATGLGLTMIGLGLSSLLGQGYVGVKAPEIARLDLPVLSDLPFIGRVLFQHDPIVYLGLALLVGVWAFLKYTRGGMILRAVGENHEAAHGLGYNVVRIRILAILFGGACAGLGGAYLSLVRVPTYADGLTAGAGWIALAIVVFASWKPGRLLLGAYLFGGVGALQLNMQGANISLLDVLALVGLITGVALTVTFLIKRDQFNTKQTRNRLIWIAITLAGGAVLLANALLGWGLKIDETLWLSASPYLVTILVLVVMSAGRAPGSLGKSFHASR